MCDLIISKEDLSKMSLEDAKRELGKRIYEGALFAEQLEHTGKFWGNARHFAQKITNLAIIELQHRWIIQGDKYGNSI